MPQPYYLVTIVWVCGPGSAGLISELSNTAAGTRWLCRAWRCKGPPHVFVDQCWHAAVPLFSHAILIPRETSLLAENGMSKTS